MKISKKTFQFLKDLKENNDRDWFNENKDRYLEAKEEFDGFINALIAEISKFDPSVAHFTAKDCVFRIYRDVRFSKDKSPYKTHFGAHITSAPKKSEIHTRAGYYIHLEPGASMLAGGAYVPESKWLRAIREKIYSETKEFKKILNGKSFKDFFGEIQGEKLKRAPKDFPADHPEIELLKQKSFLATHEVKDKEVLATDFLKHAGKAFKALFPFDAFLNAAASD
ncbi:MAG: DUF2461 domain-containing protein [Saprospiraceae bacterium]|nr:DUF2461 domain-containing protein [Saprospiraceae bacterium]